MLICDTLLILYYTIEPAEERPGLGFSDTCLAMNVEVKQISVKFHKNKLYIEQISKF